MKRAIQKLVVRLPTQSPPPDEITLSSAALKTLREAQHLQKTMHDSYNAQDHLLLSLIKDPSVAPVLKELGLTEAALKTAIEQIRGNRRVESKCAERGFDALQKYAVDLTGLAEEGKLDPVIGRDNEIRRAVRIICRRYIHQASTLLCILICFKFQNEEQSCIHRRTWCRKDCYCRRPCPTHCETRCPS